MTDVAHQGAPVTLTPESCLRISVIITPNTITAIFADVDEAALGTLPAQSASGAWSGRLGVDSQQRTAEDRADAMARAAALFAAACTLKDEEQRNAVRQGMVFAFAVLAPATAAEAPR